MVRRVAVAGRNGAAARLAVAVAVFVGATASCAGLAAAGTGDDALLLVFHRELTFAPRTEDITDRARVIECVADAVREQLPRIRVVDFETFREVAFPHLDAALAPRKPAYLPLLLEKPTFRERIAPLGIRHVAFIGGVTHTEPSGGIECVGGPYGGAACFGGIVWDKRSRLGARVLDLTGSGALEDVKASATGASWLVVIGVLPLGAAADTVGAACEDLGNRLAGHLGATTDIRE